ncbi:hypothetical protein NMG60_11032759 [Bertholletia excelsa]
MIKVRHSKFSPLSIDIILVNQILNPFSFFSLVCLLLGSFPVPAFPPLAFLPFDELTRYTPFPAPRGPLPEYGDEPRLSQEEQKQALKMLRKEIYNPRATAKRLARSLSLYYRRSNSGGSPSTRFRKDDEEEEEEDDDDERKRCAVCLDDFEPKQMVMLTPCNHMFHEECIVPWLKSRAQCPVCRFVIYQPTRAHNSYNNINNAQLPPPATDEEVRGERPSVFRLLETVFGET